MTTPSDDSPQPPAADPRPGVAAYVALGAVVVVYAGLSYYSSSNPSARGLAAGLSVGPVLLIGLVFLWRWTRPWIFLTIAAALAAALYRCWGLIESNYEWADLIQQCGVYGLVAVSFARTLTPGRIPLCTQLSTKIHGTPSPAEARYTRRATLAWALFYLGLACSIAILFFAAPSKVWSLFVNFGTFALIAAMCIADASIRHFALPRRPGGVLALVRQTFIG